MRFVKPDMLNAKEIAKEIAETGLLALLFNPLALLILIIAFLVFLAVGLGIIIYYGLTTAIVLFVLSAIGVLILHYTKAVDLTKQPLLAALPFIMLAVGYFGERLRIFAIQPLWITQTTATTGNLQPFIMLIILIILAAAIASKRR
ncbi:hypothetical protein DRO69_01395 [Candidatus Bathyarchaeota archaeon]|nr:MAG: hypothetical protein DRO69_01395 [Candidatus Bathyarchaeota archaeon]